MYIEDEFTELKEILTKDIKKEIIAFANTHGGKIYIGIDDSGKIVGVKNPNEDMESIASLIRDGIKGDLTLYTTINLVKLEGKDVIEVDVMDSPNKPYYLSDKGMKSSGVYLRFGNTSGPASEEAIKKMLLENQSDAFETLISSNQDLSFKTLMDTFASHEIKLDDNKMKSLNVMTSDGKYTNLGLLLSDECPYSIKCAIYNGTNNIEFKDRKEFTGSLLKQVSDAFEYLMLFNKTKGEIVGLERIDTRDYPEYALRETLLNAIIHRSYNYKGSILISLFDDRIEITSLGGIVSGLSIKDLYLGVSETRNQNLANVFYRLKYVESFGTGIGRILKSYEKFDMKPKFTDSDNAFKVTLYNCNYNDNTIIKKDNTHQEDTIIKYLKENKKIERSGVEKLINVSTTRAKNILKKMCDDKQIKMIGNTRNISYVLNEF
ncbi:MAG: putative DNA binding domain-containing protein [Clostridia bacterium]|nr:putative DNA binding domain-containing protein [Clostridia bacterium]